MYTEAQKLFVECQASAPGAFPVIASQWGADSTWTIHLRAIPYDEALRFVVENRIERTERDPDPAGEDTRYFEYPALYGLVESDTRPAGCLPAPYLLEEAEPERRPQILSSDARPQRFTLVSLRAVYVAQQAMLTLEEAAEELGHAGAGSLRKAISGGRLEAVKRGGAWFVERRALEHALDEGKIRSLKGAE